MTRRGRRGFTLIEVAVGLATAGVILLLARGIMEGIGDAGRRIVSAAQHQDSSAVAELSLRELVAMSGAAAAESSGVFGDGRRAQVRGRCQTAGGWRQPCVVAIEVGGDSLLIYLHDSKDGGTWLRSWSAGRATPLALGIVADRDTVILPTGARP